MISVLVADDQDLVRDGLVAIIEAEPDLVVAGEAADGEEALRLARQTSPDVVVMDIRMPVMDGVAATRAIAGQEQPPYVLMLTTFELDEYVLLKDAPRERLTEAIRRVAAGEAQLAPSVTARLIDHVLVTRRCLERLRHPCLRSRRARTTFCGCSPVD